MSIKSFIPFFKMLFFAFAVIYAIPRKHLKKHFLYGFFFGGIGDVLMVLIASGLFKQFRYMHTEPFTVFGLFSYWTPLAWMFTLMLFFYLLPVRKIFLYLYIAGFAAFGYMIGLVLEGLGVFQYIGTYRYIAPFVLLGWFSLSAYAYIKLENISLVSGAASKKP